MAIRDTLLLACGTAASRGTLRSIFEDSFNILETDNKDQTLLFLHQNHPCIASVLLDTTDPEKGGAEVLTEMNRLLFLEEIPVIYVTDQNHPHIVCTAFEQGASDVVFTNSDPIVIHHRVQAVVDLYRNKWYLEEVVEEQESILRHSNEALVDALSSIIEYRSVESGQHILRVRQFTKILLEDLARCCPEYKLDKDTIEIISSASALHDVGKIAIPDAILNKPGKLTADEWTIMRSHTTAGCRIIETLSDIGNHEYLRYAHNICHYHHERWNGGGYPEGISGDEIPICAQVVGLADVYDALTTKRVYKDAYSYEQAVNMILNEEGGTFSPKILACFKHVLGAFESLAKDYADGKSPNTEEFNVTLPGPDYQSGMNTLQMAQSKYISLLHHVNSTAFEIDIDQGMFHAIYSPHLDLSSICSCATLAEAITAFSNMVIPEEQERLKYLFEKEITAFFASGNRRMVHHFHTQVNSHEPIIPYQVTILRPNPGDESMTLLALLQRSNGMSATHTDIPSLKKYLPKDAVHGLLTGLLRYRNDRWFTLESNGAKLAELLGYTSKELYEDFGGRLIDLVVPEDQEMVRHVISQQLLNSPSIALGYRLRHKNGNTIWVLNKSHLSVETDGNEYLYGTLTDITYSQKVQQELYANLERYRTILEAMDSIIFEWNPETDQAYFSQKWESFFGYPPLTANVTERLAAASHFHPEDLPVVIQMFQDMKNGVHNFKTLEVRIANANGRYHWIRMRKTAVRDGVGDLLKVVGILTCIDDEKIAALALQEQAERDSLTRLLNKQTGRKQIEAYLSENQEDLSCAMLIIDMDNFKNINDSLGHLFGDAVLTHAAKEIKKLFRSHDIITRIGGDEFMVLMKGTSDQTLIENRCAQLIRAFRNLFPEQLKDRPLGCSIGIAISPEHGDTYTELFKHADQALYHAKSNGKNTFAVYNGNENLLMLQKQSSAANRTPIDSDEQPGLSSQNIVQYTFQRLYEAENIEATIQNILGMIGSQMNVSRVYIFENSEDNKTCSNTFEWCNVGISPEIDNLKDISYETDIPGYEDNFNEQGVFYCPDVTMLPKEAFEIVDAQGIKAMLQHAIRDNGVFRGYIGFDDCHTNRYWTKEQISTLMYFAETLSVFLLKKRTEDAYKKLRESKADELK